MAVRSLEWTVDLVFAVALALLVPAAVLVVGLQGLPRAAITLPFLLFVPGYVFLAAVYPERYEESTTSRDAAHPLAARRAQAGIPLGERLVLSMLISAVLTPLVALVLNFTPLGVRARPVLLGIAGLSLFLAVIGLARRAMLEQERRGGVPLSGRGNRGARDSRRGGTLASQSSRRSGTTEKLLRGLVVVALLLLPATAAFAYAAPADGQDFTELSITAENASGNHTVEALPTTIQSGTEEPVSVSITNQEGQQQTYTVVTMLQRAERADGGVRVESSQRLDRFERTVAPGEQVRFDHSLGPIDSGGEYRVVYLLYRGEPPNNPTRENAYRSVRLWVTVTESSVETEIEAPS
ncbi:DUF1616 domain-containing protein [Haloarchaeobius baliensis]|uniref:DUF1616 domain-containing protein n=1 Tax=Haloarchaeobius baliensis TaxID=1670458 RepID=UPI003F883E69